MYILDRSTRYAVVIFSTIRSMLIAPVYSFDEGTVLNELVFILIVTKKNVFWYLEDKQQ